MFVPDAVGPLTKTLFVPTITEHPGVRLAADRQLTNVVQACKDVRQDPMMKESQNVDVLFDLPPNMPLKLADAMFCKPPTIVEYCPALQIVGFTDHVQVAGTNVPPVVLLPTPPTTTLPNEQTAPTELQILLQKPDPMKL